MQASVHLERESQCMKGKPPGLPNGAGAGNRKPMPLVRDMCDERSCCLIDLAHSPLHPAHPLPSLATHSLSAT